jgi:hypothetical protein
MPCMLAYAVAAPRAHLPAAISHRRPACGDRQLPGRRNLLLHMMQFNAPSTGATRDAGCTFAARSAKLAVPPGAGFRNELRHVPYTAFRPLDSPETNDRHRP